MLWGISFDAAVVFGLGKDFLFKSALGHCAITRLTPTLSSLEVLKDFGQISQ